MQIQFRVRSATRSFLVAVLFTAGWNSLSCADDSPRELPKDGAWVRWQCETKFRDEDPVSSVVTMKIVGTVLENERQCRWIERKQEIKNGKGAGLVAVNKLLVPEQELLNSEQPLDNVLRMRIRSTGGRISTIERDKINVGSFDWQELVVWTPGVLKGSELAIDLPKDVDHQDGKLVGAEPRTGDRTFASNSRRFSGEIVEGKGELKYTVWQHRELPFGFAEAQFVGRRTVNKVGSETTKTYRLQAFGFGAKSELEDGD